MKTGTIKRLKKAEKGLFSHFPSDAALFLAKISAFRAYMANLSAIFLKDKGIWEGLVGSWVKVAIEYPAVNERRQN